MQFVQVPEYYISFMALFYLSSRANYDYYSFSVESYSTYSRRGHCAQYLSLALAFRVKVYQVRPIRPRIYDTPSLLLMRSVRDLSERELFSNSNVYLVWRKKQRKWNEDRLVAKLKWTILSFKTYKFSWHKNTTETARLGTECCVNMNETSFFASEFK